ncbi:multicopper oxidase domain-containing protein [Neobacillus mesonae]|uniref:multicopper oxidase domain-containing protein n=1 Tax=Neobacillus mesonae TaxID=1193713 RepID=UPI00203BEB38|nr:multicopper oxidase domain-containing protein [Neobacillus mesonae]MCM3567371.1 multicopper oxidase domain-containing protein [Neobacillus mesonae]
MRKLTKFAAVMVTSVMVLGACGKVDNLSVDKKVEAQTTTKADAQVFGPHENLNQKPTPIKIKRTGAHEVNIEMTAQITDIELSEGDMYKAWTFNGEAPGPVIVVNQGDKINFTLKNMDPAIPHSMDMHAVHTAPSKNFVDVMPNKTGSFSYPADNPGVFMYHCGTKPVLGHIANGMHGMIIVKPATGYPTDSKVDREYVVIQNEWYKYNDLNDMTNGVPKYVVFSTKALKDGDVNTNGTVGALQDHPLLAKVGDKVRFYVLNVGPNEVSSFHVVGTLFDDVYLDGNPENHLKGMQTVMLPASGGAVVEFTVTEEGSYPIVTHQFNDATKGAVGALKVTKDGSDDNSKVMSH